jgi:hypothetical protein
MHRVMESDEAVIARINTMTHEQMAHAWRYAPTGDAQFRSGLVYDAWKARFDAFGGWTPEVSKQIGWGG